MRMARVTWAILQPHSKKKIKESDLVFDWNYGKHAKDAPKDAHEYWQKALRVYANQGGLEVDEATKERTRK